MVGLRSVLFGLVLSLPVVLFAPTQREAIDLDMVEAKTGLLVMRHEVTIALWQHCVT